MDMLKLEMDGQVTWKRDETEPTCLSYNKRSDTASTDEHAWHLQPFTDSFINIACGVLQT